LINSLNPLSRAEEGNREKDHAPTLCSPYHGYQPGGSKYLDRPQIVQRIGSNELKLAETHRWAEPLRNNFTQVLAENLSLMIPTRQTTLFPWTRSTRIDYQVQVIVNRFDADTNGNAVLSASWKVLRKDPDEVLAMEKSTYTEAASGTDYDAIVTAQSRALAALSLEIAKVIRAGP
jgi:uncharacterized lipoprotein YmbA